MNDPECNPKDDVPLLFDNPLGISVGVLEVPIIETDYKEEQNKLQQEQDYISRWPHCRAKDNALKLLQDIWTNLDTEKKTSNKSQSFKQSCI